MTAQDLIKFWRLTAKEDLITAEELVKNKRYHHGLFFCHLTLEKLLKGLIIKKINTQPSPIHNLLVLAKEATLKVDKSTEEKLKEISSWNINARYDDYKREFYHKATKEFTEKWVKTVKELIVWIEKHY